MSATYAETTSSRNFREYRREPCPVCKHKGWCRRFNDGGIECMRTPNDYRCASGGWMHWPDGHPDDWRERIATAHPHPSRPTVDAGLVDRAYTELLRLCPLSDADRVALAARGVNDEQATRHGYGSLPEDKSAHARIAQAVAEAVGCDPAGQVPGFVRRVGHLTLVNIPGLLVPVRDSQGRIVGMKVRPVRQRPGRKYVWLSAGDGAASIGQNGSVVHIANPPRPVSTQRVVATESPLKANIAADLLGMIVIAGDGVTNTAGIPAALADLSGVEEVWIANDKDAEVNEYAVAGEARLARQLADAGYRVMQLTWPAEAGKGLDDILTTSPPTIPVATPHPSLSTLTTKPQARPEEVVRELEQLKRLHSLATAARHSPNLGNERHVLTDFATALAPVPDGEWAPMPYAKVGEQAAVDARTAERQLQKAGIRPKEGDAGILAGLVEVTLREVPERVNPRTGEVVGGYKAMHARRLAPLSDILERIATAPAPAGGKRHNHGGKRVPCPKCGETAIERTTTDRCAGCGELLRQTVRIAADDDDEFTLGVKMTPTPPRQDAVRAEDSGDAPFLTNLPVSVYRDDNLTPAPLGRAQNVTRERREQAATHLAAWQDRLRGTQADECPESHSKTPDGADAAPDSPQLTLFSPDNAVCETCGRGVPEGQRHCRDCDPWTS
jgi:hypothetical protein